MISNIERPQILSDVKGQTAVTKTLAAQMKTKSWSQAYLFEGVRGTGKTTTARIMAKAMNCKNPKPNGEPCNECENCRMIMDGLFPDVVELDAAQRSSVEDARLLVNQVVYPPIRGKRRVFIIDEVHNFSSAAFNTLLKTIEEPPEWVTFILCTTEKHKVPATIISRCQSYNFGLVDDETVSNILYNIVEKKGLPANLDAMLLIARAGKGSVRDSLSILDKCLDSGEEITAEYVRELQGIPDSALVTGLLDSIVHRDLKAMLESIDGYMYKGISPTLITDYVTDALTDAIRVKAGARIRNEIEYVQNVTAFAESVTELKILSLINLFREARKTVMGDMLGYSALEGDLIGYIAGETEMDKVQRMVTAAEESCERILSMEHSAGMHIGTVETGSVPEQKTKPVATVSPEGDDDMGFFTDADPASWFDAGNDTPFESVYDDDDDDEEEEKSIRDKIRALRGTAPTATEEVKRDEDEDDDDGFIALDDF